MENIPVEDLIVYLFRDKTVRDQRKGTRPQELISIIPIFVGHRSLHKFNLFALNGLPYPKECPFRIYFVVSY